MAVPGDPVIGAVAHHQHRAALVRVKMAAVPGHGGPLIPDERPVDRVAMHVAPQHRAARVTFGDELRAGPQEAHVPARAAAQVTRGCYSCLYPMTAILFYIIDVDCHRV